VSSEQWVLAGVVLCAGFVQGSVGFGFGMLSMAVLPYWLSVQEVVPIISLLGLFIIGSVLWRWRHSLEPGAIRPLLVGTLIGTPFGAYGLSWIDRRLALGVLGAVLVLVALPSFLAVWRGAPRSARAAERLEGWAWPIGVLSGLFGGAFNTGGPPLILYGSARGWAPSSFRANLQVVFLASSLVQLVVLFSTGIANQASLELAAVGLPAVLVGVTLGGSLAARLDTRAVRLLVWALLLLLGANFLREAFAG
jgi:uncharacterized membrane protein YfcA